MLEGDPSVDSRSPGHWQRAQELFHAALDKAADDRVEFLDQACFGNADLRRDVEELLAAETGASERIDSAISGALWLMRQHEPPADSNDSAPPSERPPHALPDTLDVSPAAVLNAAAPEHIGPYRILETLGRGGMGSVYLAERDDEHYRQQVAIKVMRHGLDHPEILRRLRQERQILAHLDHPNIARLLDGGNTPEGLPYFVMERVEGEPIVDFCDHDRLPLRARLELFLQVCSAVQYAHRNLVVHRDLKPSNILVSEDGTPKLLDFGIAKLLDPELADPMFAPTVPGMRLLTPQYASPEQIRGEPANIASDVYSLGVLLYELLTGHRPHHAERRAELERRVCEAEPLPPSQVVLTRNTTGGVEWIPEAVSATREGTPERLRRGLAGDLDTIVLEALHKEPARRYASVEHLADDLRRHLAGLPVSARPDSLAYRGRKFIARHRLAVVTAAAVALTIFGLVLFYTLRLGEQRDAAERAAQRAQQAAQLAQREAAKSEQVTGFLTEIFERADPNVAKGDEATVLEVLDQGAAQLERRLRDQPELLSQMRDVIARVYSGRGRYREARELFQRSLDERLDRLGAEHADVATSWHHLGDVAHLESASKTAAGLFRRALDLRLRLFGPDHPEVAASRQGLATALYNEPGAAETSLELYHQALATRRRELGDGQPLVAETLSSLGYVYHDLERLAEAET
ncbi:MAG: serine/threonine-protein kinase [Acidobacteriota bacterium]